MTKSQIWQKHLAGLLASRRWEAGGNISVNIIHHQRALSGDLADNDVVNISDGVVRGNKCCQDELMMMWDEVIMRETIGWPRQSLAIFAR